MKENTKSDVEMEESSQGDNNRNLITVLITLIVLVIVVVIYWDRQKQRDFQQVQAEIQGGILEEWGPQAQQEINSALSVKPISFSCTFETGSNNMLLNCAALRNEWNCSKNGACHDSKMPAAVGGRTFL